MSSTKQLFVIWCLSATAQTVAWTWQRRNHNAGIVDAVWAASLGSAALLLAALGNGSTVSRVMLAALGGIWGWRLALYLLRRVRGEHEDGRYARLRTLWGDDQRKWFAFFQFQALLVVLFATPFIPASNQAEAPTLIWLVSAVLIWVFAVAGETLADAQLAQFRATPGNQGLVCREGLWRYSRHPNYFFEWLHWFSYVALASGAAISWLGPVLMYVFLRWLSGIPHTEAQALRTRGELYRAYQRTTPMLIPWFPRSEP